MKRWRLRIYSGGILIALLVVCGFYVYETYQPSNHFHPFHLPVLAVPSYSDEPAALPPASVAAELSDRVTERPEPVQEPGEAVAVNRSEQTVAKDRQEELPNPGKPNQVEESTGFNVLVLGLDSREKEASRSDALMVAHVDPDQKSVHVLSIPRDTRVYLPGVGLTKVNHAYFLGAVKGGSEKATGAAIQAVSNLLRIPVHYYVKTDLKGFVELIDAIGGIEVELSKEVRISASRKVLPAGVVQMDGETALGFARERYSLADGDFGRQAGQVDVLKAAVKKMLSRERIAKLPELIGKLRKEAVETNMTDGDLLSLAWLFKDTDPKNIRRSSVPGRSVTEEDPLVGSKLWYWEPDRAALDSIVSSYMR
jgi:LCP family protein required for cell wall assembly